MNDSIDAVIKSAEEAMKFFNTETQIRVRKSKEYYQIDYVGGLKIDKVTSDGLIKLAEYEKLYWHTKPKGL